jgi:hypothetical protein
MYIGNRRDDAVHKDRSVRETSLKSYTQGLLLTILLSGPLLLVHVVPDLRLLGALARGRGLLACLEGLLVFLLLLFPSSYSHFPVLGLFATRLRLIGPVGGPMVMGFQVPEATSDPRRHVISI